MQDSKRISDWEPHNLLQFVEKHRLDEFTVDDIIKMNDIEWYAGMWYNRCLNRLCAILLKNKYITATYFSEGRKTVARYKYVKRKFENG